MAIFTYYYLTKGQILSAVRRSKMSCRIGVLAASNVGLEVVKFLDIYFYEIFMIHLHT